MQPRRMGSKLLVCWRTTRPGPQASWHITAIVSPTGSACHFLAQPYRYTAISRIASLLNLSETIRPSARSSASVLRSVFQSRSHRLCLPRGAGWAHRNGNNSHGLPNTTAQLAAWSNYVSKTVAHTKDRVTYWEIWCVGTGMQLLCDQPCLLHHAIQDPA